VTPPKEEGYQEGDHAQFGCAERPGMRPRHAGIGETGALDDSCVKAGRERVGKHRGVTGLVDPRTRVGGTGREQDGRDPDEGQDPPDGADPEDHPGESLARAPWTVLS
jgi:hypothetical protein